jgi:hypothetical protein
VGHRAEGGAVVKRSKARRLAWGLAVMWDAEFGPQAAVPAAPAVVHVVHHYLPAGVGGVGPDPRVIEAILQPRAAIASEGTGGS